MEVIWPLQATMANLCPTSCIQLYHMHVYRDTWTAAVKRSVVNANRVIARVVKFKHSVNVACSKCKERIQNLQNSLMEVILENQIMKMLNLCHPQNLHASKICTYRIAQNVGGEKHW